MKRFLGIVMASMFLASTAYAQDKKDEAAAEKTEKSAKSKDSKAKSADKKSDSKAKPADAKSGAMEDEKKSK